ncbi:MAG: DUF6171 family protein [Clostridiales bacterium]|nr:DUF6171 family protein [Clostridiales bacterium]
MSGERICRRCLLFESGREDVLLDVRRRIEKIPDNEKCPDEIYKSRLTLCGECEHLIDGTCLKCGCYPEFRASFLKQKCPSKKW